MSILTIVTPFNIDLEFKIAPFGKRFSAWLVDILLICLYYYINFIFLSHLFPYHNNLTNILELIIIIIPILLYQLLCELLMNGQTIGKKIVGIKVIDTEGNEPTWGQYILRWILCIGNLFIYLIPIAMLYLAAFNIFILIFFLLLYFPDTLFVLNSAKSQRISDFAAGTVVIDCRFKPNINETIFLEIEDQDYKPVFPQVLRLTDKDINGIRNLLSDHQSNRYSEQYTLQIVHKIKNALGISSDLYPIDFLKQLLMDYNYLTMK